MSDNSVVALGFLQVGLCIASVLVVLLFVIAVRKSYFF